ncbi:unnamed protein product [Closterium sp. NIES-54]
MGEWWCCGQLHGPTEGSAKATVTGVRSGVRSIQSRKKQLDAPESKTGGAAGQVGLLDSGAAGQVGLLDRWGCWTGGATGAFLVAVGTARTVLAAAGAASTFLAAAGAASTFLAAAGAARTVLSGLGWRQIGGILLMGRQIAACHVDVATMTAAAAVVAAVAAAPVVATAPVAAAAAVARIAAVAAAPVAAATEVEGSAAAHATTSTTGPCLPDSLAPLLCSLVPPCTPCLAGRQCAAPHSSSFPPTTAPLQTLHLDVWGPSLVLGPRQERYFLVVVDDYSRYTMVFPLQRKADTPNVLEPWLLTRVLHATRLAAAERGSRATHRPGHGGFLDLHVSGAGAPRFLWPQAVRYATHQLNLWPSDARPRVTPVSHWIGSPGVAADYRVWGCLAHVRSPGVNKLSARTRACVFLGFPLDALGWVFYDPFTHQFFASQDVTFDESVSYYRSRPHRGSKVFPPPRFSSPLSPPQVSPVAPSPSRPAPSGVSHVTLQYSPPQHPVPVVSGGAGGAVAEGEGTGAAGARGASSGGAGVVRVETAPEEDTAVSTQRPHPATPPGFFPPRSPPRPVAAEPGGVPAGGTGVPGGVVGEVSCSGGAGAGNTTTTTPTLCTVCFLTTAAFRQVGEGGAGAV